MAAGMAVSMVAGTGRRSSHRYHACPRAKYRSPHYQRRLPQQIRRHDGLRPWRVEVCGLKECNGDETLQR